MQNEIPTTIESTIKKMYIENSKNDVCVKRNITPF